VNLDNHRACADAKTGPLIGEDTVPIGKYSRNLKPGSFGPIDAGLDRLAFLAGTVGTITFPSAYDEGTGPFLFATHVITICRYRIAAGIPLPLVRFGAASGEVLRVTNR
jgi:hypothetical protein